jgi:hypothetical protein
MELLCFVVEECDGGQGDVPIAGGDGSHTRTPIMLQGSGFPALYGYRNVNMSSPISTGTTTVVYSHPTHLSLSYTFAP